MEVVQEIVMAQDLKEAAENNQLWFMIKDDKKLSSCFYLMVVNN